MPAALKTTALPEPFPFIPGSNYVTFDGTDHELLDKGANGYGAILTQFI